MDTQAPLPLTERLSRIIWAGLRAVGNRSRADSVLGPALPLALLELIGLRLHNLRRRFVSLMARIEAGTLRPLPEPGQARPHTRPADPTPRPKPAHQPREVWGWLLNIGRQPAAVVHYDLQQFLEDPELQALIAAHPRRIGRILRPLCRMFGVSDIPDVLRLPSQDHVVTVDWAAVDRLRQAELAARAAGLPPPVPPQTTFVPKPSRKRQPPFRFYLTPFGHPQLE